MCKIIKTDEKLEAAPNITVELQRDASIRAHEVLVENTGPEGTYGVIFYCFDNGRIGIRDDDGEELRFVYPDIKLDDPEPEAADADGAG